jgi:GT2 family glycosyltransferase
VSPAAAPDLTWVVVSYGGVPDAVHLVESLGQAPGLRIVLCANKPGDAEQARTTFADDPRIEVLDFEDNPGYLPALARALPQIDTTAPVVLSNCDLLADPGFLERLQGELDAHPDAGALAPAIIGSLGADQNPNLLRPPTARWLRALALVHRFPPVADLLLLRKEGHSSRNISGAQPGDAVWAGHGSCIVLTPRFFAEGGRCDYPFKLFGEELWIGKECARLGLTVRYTPAAVLRHAEHATTGRRRRGEVARVKYAGLRYWADQARQLGW